MQKLLNIKQVAKIYQVTVRTIEMRMKKGKMPPPITPPGVKRLWNAEDIEHALVFGWGRKEEKEMPETPSQRKWREALADAECARWGI